MQGISNMLRNVPFLTHDQMSEIDISEHTPKSLILDEPPK
jgi:hypothetical protein